GETVQPRVRRGHPPLSRCAFSERLYWHVFAEEFHRPLRAGCALPRVCSWRHLTLKLTCRRCGDRWLWNLLMIGGHVQRPIRRAVYVTPSAGRAKRCWG